MEHTLGFIREWKRLVINIYISFDRIELGGGIHSGSYFRWNAPYTSVVALEFDILILHIQLGWLHGDVYNI